MKQLKTHTVNDPPVIFVTTVGSLTFALSKFTLLISSHFLTPIPHQMTSSNASKIHYSTRKASRASAQSTEINKTKRAPFHTPHCNDTGCSMTDMPLGTMWHDCDDGSHSIPRELALSALIAHCVFQTVMDVSELMEYITTTHPALCGSEDLRALIEMHMLIEQSLKRGVHFDDGISAADGFILGSPMLKHVKMQLPNPV